MFESINSSLNIIFFYFSFTGQNKLQFAFLWGGGNYFKFKDLNTLIYERKTACYSKKRIKTRRKFGTQRKKTENMNY